MPKPVPKYGRNAIQLYSGEVVNTSKISDDNYAKALAIGIAVLIQEEELKLSDIIRNEPKNWSYTR